MRATLIHNSTAGSGKPSAEELVGWLEECGYTVRYSSSNRKKYARALEESSDLIVVAGGDGTVAKIAKRMVGRDVPLAIVPVGTSNNIATTLGIRGTPDAIIRALPTAERRTLDAGTARGPWGASLFVESAGLGLFAAILEHADRTAELRKKEKPARDQLAQNARGTQRLLDDQPARFCRIEADGADLSGSYVLAVAMNIKRIGSCLELAPDADAADGLFDLVLLGDDARDTLRAYLEGLARGDGVRFPLVPRRVKVVRIEWDSTVGHLDDELWPEDEEDRARDHLDTSLVELAILDPPVAVLIGRGAR